MKALGLLITGAMLGAVVRRFVARLHRTVVGLPG
jgi:hypothetical protein